MLDHMRRRGVPGRSRRAPEALVLAVLLASCGGSGGSAVAPDPPPAPAGAPAATFTVTLTATGANPRELRVPVGARVTFVNQDSRSHQMMSDPHPVHTDCPEVNALGSIDRGETKLTGALSVQKACGFHDHLRDGDASLRGFILVGSAEPGPGPGGPGY